MSAVAEKVVLHLGCGAAPLPEHRFSDGWREVRVDLNEDTKPDVVADIRELPFEAESCDAIYCHSCLEHVAEADLARTLYGFRRVLRDGGRLMLVVPDLGAICKRVAEGGLVDIIHETEAGPVRPLDMIYGHQAYVRDFPLMTHRTGFTAATLTSWLSAAGFTGSVESWEEAHLLWAEARKEDNES